MSVDIVPDERGGYVVLVDGRPQSHVDADDPLDLAFEYVAITAAAIHALLPGRARVRATHVGGAGLTLPRWIHATRPGSPQIVLEPDGALTALVRGRLPLPRGHRIRVRETDGATGMAALATGSADLVVVDAYAEGRVPAELGAVPFLDDCGRVLVADGLLVLNLADEPEGRYSDRVAAGVRAAGLEHRLIVATTDIAKGRRFGNRVLLASPVPLDRGALERELRRLAWPTRVLLARPARPFTAADQQPSPSPPTLDRRWRVR
ncbi:MAG: fused MFS/spermidine synthase [Dermatophilaceae bacterium]